MSIPTLTLNDGHTIPAIGFGTFPHAGDDSRTTAISALDAGYRLLDTALRYENEQGVGRAVREYGLPREDISCAPSSRAATTATTRRSRVVTNR